MAVQLVRQGEQKQEVVDWVSNRDGSNLAAVDKPLSCPATVLYRLHRCLRRHPHDSLAALVKYIAVEHSNTNAVFHMVSPNAWRRCHDNNGARRHLLKTLKNNERLLIRQAIARLGYVSTSIGVGSARRHWPGPANSSQCILHRAGNCHDELGITRRTLDIDSGVFVVNSSLGQYVQSFEYVPCTSAAIQHA